MITRAYVSSLCVLSCLSYIDPYFISSRFIDLNYNTQPAGLQQKMSGKRAKKYSAVGRLSFCGRIYLIHAQTPERLYLNLSQPPSEHLKRFRLLKNKQISLLEKSNASLLVL